MANTDINNGGSYTTTFADLPNHTTYSNPCNFMMKSDDHSMTIERDVLKSRMDVGLKAITSTTGGAGTAGYALVPVYVDPRIVDVTRKRTPIVEIIPRVTNIGRTADYNQITAKGGAFTRAEDAVLTETTTTYDRQSTVIKYLYAVGRSTGQATATIPPYTLSGFQPAGGAVGSFSDQGASNANQQEVLVKTREIRELEENLIINGNATTSYASGNPNGTEYDGIIQLMSTTNTVDLNTTDLTWDNIDTAVQYAFDDGGRPTVALASSSVVNDIRKLIRDTLRIEVTNTSEAELGFGVPAAISIYTMVGGITVIPSMFMTNTSGSKAIYFLDMSVVEMRVLQDLTFEKLSKTNDSDKFYLKIYEALIIKNTAFCSSITEIK